ncbi:putative retrotransposon gag domain-containing protein [Helianthus annuus]|nr:putative retrotransposon gag domain-containing protein [Helianthus annuus]
MSKCASGQQVTYITGLFTDGALSWWNLQVQTLGEAAAYAMTWAELKELMRKKYCSRTEIQRLETEFWNLRMEGPKIAEYVQRFHDLSHVVPYMVTPEFKRVERFIWGLAPQIMSMVRTSKPATITEAIDLSISLTEEAIRLNKFSKDDPKKKETHVESSGENKRKFFNFKQGTNRGSKRSESTHRPGPRLVMKTEERVTWALCPSVVHVSSIIPARADSENANLAGRRAIQRRRVGLDQARVAKGATITTTVVMETGRKKIMGETEIVEMTRIKLVTGEQTEIEMEMEMGMAEGQDASTAGTLDTSKGNAQR